MHITYLTDNDPFDPDFLSGTPYWILKEFLREGMDLQNVNITLPHKLLPPLEELVFRIKHFWFKFYKQIYLSPDYFDRRARYIAKTFNEPLSKFKTDVILTSFTPLLPAYLDTKTPIVYWTDAVYAALVNFYPKFRFHHPDTMWDGHVITNAALQNATLLLFSSQWAARTAVEFYGVSKEKIHVVPFGANLDISHSHEDVINIINKRSKKCINLLFVGKDWYRKGGDIALDIAKALHNAGQAVKLVLVGCDLSDQSLPPYVGDEGFISKSTSEGIKKLKKLYEEAHFLIMPSRAECCAVAFAEANAFGVPCLTTYVGGIPDAIKDGQNGMTFSLEATLDDFCNYITSIFSNEKEYSSLALSSFNEYQQRLNWASAIKKVKALIIDHL